MKIKVIYTPDGEGGFEASSVVFPECIGHGKTRGDALVNLKKTIERHVEKEENQIDKKADIHVLDLCG